MKVKGWLCLLLILSVIRHDSTGARYLLFVARMVCVCGGRGCLVRIFDIIILRRDHCFA